MNWLTQEVAIAFIAGYFFRVVLNKIQQRAARKRDPWAEMQAGWASAERKLDESLKRIDEKFAARNN